MITLLVLTFFAVVGTGPDGLDWLARRRRLREFPIARQLAEGHGYATLRRCSVCNATPCRYR